MKAFVINRGFPRPLGATVAEDGVNFSLFSRHATSVSLVLFRPGQEEPFEEIQFDLRHHRTGDIWHMQLADLPLDTLYGYRVDGPYDPVGKGHHFTPEHVLIDPYAKAVAGGETWGEPQPTECVEDIRRCWRRRCRIVADDFDWEGDRPLNIPLQDSIIYELPVRGFTQDPSSGVAHPGTFMGVVEKIPYLKKLGITAVELMPVAEFNENEIMQKNPLTGERLRNLWGYSTMAFCAPKAGLAADAENGNQVQEFKEMVKVLHRAGIEVILDVVFNHTAEGGADGPVLSFRGLDNVIYYILDPKTRDYLNFTGCGNTTNCNHPVVRQLIMDCLHYWVTEMHVDGFRFDLASILGRDTKGKVLSNPPMVEQIAEDPVLAHTKIIAEAWDAAGLYQVGNFSTSARWAEWNGRFRDDVRRVLCGHQGMVARLATRISGSSDLYQEHDRGPANSINFITSHDGYTLHDLVSYNEKYNLANGEENRDGANDNISWNSGVEGETDDQEVLQLRERRMRTFAVILFLSQGVPMFVAGEEFGRTQQGNNNTYCQDNPLGWVDWRLAEKNKGLLRFFRLLIGLRKAHAVFRRTTFFPESEEARCREIGWQSVEAGQSDWSSHCKTLAFFLHGERGGEPGDDDFFVALNGHGRSKTFKVPSPRKGYKWLRIIDTAAPSPRDILPEEQGKPLGGRKIEVAGNGAVVLVGKPAGGKG